MKKTKAEKRLADLHRIVEYNQSIKVTKNVQVAKNSGGKYIYENNSLNAAESSPQSKSLYIYPVQLIRKDLTKTLVLCILAISLELGLYIYLEKPGLLSF